MNVADTRMALTGNAVAVPTTIWKQPGVLDLEANAANAGFLFANGITAAVYAGGVGEHDLLSRSSRSSCCRRSPRPHAAMRKIPASGPGSAAPSSG